MRYKSILRESGSELVLLSSHSCRESALQGANCKRQHSGMPTIGFLTSVIAGSSRRPLQATLKPRLVRPCATFAHRTCCQQRHLSQQLPPSLGGGAAVGSPACSTFSTKSGAESDHIASDGGVLLPRHQAKVSSSGSTGVKDILVNRSGLLPPRPDIRWALRFREDPGGNTVRCIV